MKNTINMIFKSCLSIFLFGSIYSFGQALPFSSTTPGMGTYTVPLSGVTSIIVECIGGGGGGGYAIGTNGAAGGGGGGGAYAKSIITVTPGQVINFRIGGRGAAGKINGTAATNGGNTWFVDNTTLLARGGRAGESVSTNTSGAGGNGNLGSSIGDVLFKGGDGAAGLNGTGAGFGGGGGGSAGFGAAGNDGIGITGGTGIIAFEDGGSGARNSVGGTGGLGAGGSGGHKDNSNSRGGFGGFGAIFISINHTLPVTLTNFSAICNNGVTLNWTTASEQNSDSFVVEKSRDGNSWINVAEQSAAGNSNTIINYSQEDDFVGDGISYYRLRQIDLNGAEQIYGPISASCSMSINNSVNIYPNPNNGAFTVEISSTENHTGAQLLLTDMTGRTIVSQTVNITAGTNQIMISNGNLQMGTYMVTVHGIDSELKPLKVVVNN